MVDFEQVRSFLEVRLEQLAQVTPDPARFRREFGNLQRYWQEEDDEGLRLEETWRVMRKYLPVWEALVDAGLVPQEERPPALQEPAEEAEQQRRPTPAPLMEEDTMKEQRLSQSILDRMAVWDRQIATAKEIVTGCMGILIVAVTLFVAVIAIFSVSSAGTQAAAKDVLLFLNGLVGVVLGYYFGRVPGEVRADKAESEAKEARSELDTTVTEIRCVLEERGVDIERGIVAEGLTLTTEQVERLRDVLRRH